MPTGELMGAKVSTRHVRRLQAQADRQQGVWLPALLKPEHVCGSLQVLVGRG